MAALLRAPIAVCIPTKDRLDRLRLAVASVYAQTVLPAEIVIVDDSSDVPLTADMLPRAPAGLALTIVRNQTNVGGAIARNQAVSASKQPIIAFLDSDDIFLPSYIAHVADFWARDNEDASALATAFFWCTDEMVPYRKHVAPRSTNRTSLLNDGNLVGGCSVLSITKELFDRVGGFANSRGVDDWALLLALSNEGDIKASSEPLVLYRAPATTADDSMTARHGRQIIALAQLLKQLSDEDAVQAQGRIRLFVANHLAKAGRQKQAFRILRSSVANGMRINKLAVQVAVTAAVGPRAMNRLMLSLARLRSHKSPLLRRSFPSPVTEYIAELNAGLLPFADAARH